MFNDINEQTEELTNEDLHILKEAGISVQFDEAQAESEAQILREFDYK
jgi:hypothetical protein